MSVKKNGKTEEVHIRFYKDFDLANLRKLEILAKRENETLATMVRDAIAVYLQKR